MEKLGIIEKVGIISSNKTFCGGDDSSTDHPKVFINLVKGKAVSCPYCGKKFFSTN